MSSPLSLERAALDEFLLEVDADPELDALAHELIEEGAIEPPPPLSRAEFLDEIAGHLRDLLDENRAVIVHVDAEDDGLPAHDLVLPATSLMEDPAASLMEDLRNSVA